MIDLHSHLLPFVDDGASDWGETRQALHAMDNAGVRSATATPHVRGSLTNEPTALDGRLSELDEVWPEFVALAARTVPNLKVARGAEVMLDQPGVNLSDSRLRLNGTRFVLVEFPHMRVPPRSAETLHELRRQGWIPVLAHPERYRGISRLAEIAATWRKAGAVLQLNAGSLLGNFGDTPRNAAILLLQGGLVDVISSDYHSRGPFPLLEARTLLETEYGTPADVRETLFDSNPDRLLADKDLWPVPPVPRRRPVWKRWFSGRR